MNNEVRTLSHEPDTIDKPSTSERPATAAYFEATLGTLLHDIRTALHQMIGYSELLIEDAEQGHYVRMSAALREVRADAKSFLAAISGFFVLSGEMGQPRYQNLCVQLNEAGVKMVARATELEVLATLEKAGGLLPDLRRFRAAAQNLLKLADLTGKSVTSAAGASEHEPNPIKLVPSALSSALPKRPPDGERGILKQHTVLVVDDSEANRDLFSRWLIREGHSVLLASNGTQALEMVRQHELDLILLDAMMPGLDGVAVLRELKADAQFCQLPVIMVSAGNEIQDVVRCIGMGAEDYLSKPFEPVLLRARVGALLERKRLRDEEERKNNELKKALLEIEGQKRLAEELLLNILPRQVAEELRAKGSVEPMYFEDVTIVFADFAGFTLSTEKLPADVLVRVLHDYFTAFDRIVDSYELEKLKTIGDCYMFVGGMPVRSSSHPVEAVLATLEMIHLVQEMASPRGLVDWQLRVGIHTGPVIAGVVGIHKFAFDIWGDSVNLSARMESCGAPNRTNLSAATYARVKDFFVCEHRGKIKTKDGRKLDMYFVDGVAPSLLEENSSSSAFERRYRSYFQKALKSYPQYLLQQVCEARP